MILYDFSYYYLKSNFLSHAIKILIYIYRKFAKYDSKFDFSPKSVPKLDSNAKVIQNTNEITTNPL